jgi:putative tricarboxylic transport membrane protein
MMEILGLLGDGFLLALQPLNLLLIIVGVTVGLFIGAMPGLGSVNGVAILLPITFLVPPSSAIIFLAAIYYGAMYGGAISSITLGIPGASTAVATTFDGRPLAMQGRASLALVTAALASFVGGTVANIFFTAFAPLLASVALSFGPPEIFALMLLAFATFVGLGGDDIPRPSSRSVSAWCWAVGFDEISGAPRLMLLRHHRLPAGHQLPRSGHRCLRHRRDALDHRATRGEVETTTAKMTVKGMASDKGRRAARLEGHHDRFLLGFFVGILPAAGATPGSLMSYGVSKMAR